MSKRHVPFYTAALISFLTFAIYIPALKNGFINWDDNINVYENINIRVLDGDFFKWAFTDIATANYWHPVTWLSFAADYAVWGLNPIGYHLTNNIFHALNTFVVVILTVKLIEAFYKAGSLRLSTKSGGSHGVLLNDRSILIAAGVTGLLFGLHPLHVESVAWVSERKDLLCAFFFLLSVLSYVSYKSNKSYKSYFLSFVFFVFALASKPMAVTLPVVLLILDWHPFKRLGSVKELLRAFAEKLPFFAFGIIVSAAAFLGHSALRAMTPQENVPLPVRLPAAASSPILYLWKTLVPVDLMPVYFYPKNISLLSAGYLLSLLLLIGITAGCILIAKKQRTLPAVWLYYIVTLLPVLGIVQVGIQSMADRFTYIPGIGPFFLVGLCSAWAWERSYSLQLNKALAQMLMVVAASLLLVSMSFLTVGYVSVWKSSMDFWNYVIAKNPTGIPVAYNNRAAAFKEAGDPGRAVEDYTRAIALGYSPVTGYNNRGLAYMEEGLLDLAVADFSKAASLEPGFAVSYYNRGLAFIKTNEMERALADFDKAIGLTSDYADAYTGRGWLYKTTGRPDLAVRDFDSAIALDNRQYIAYVNRGLIFEMNGLTDRAAKDYKTACDLGSEDGCRELALLIKQP